MRRHLVPNGCLGSLLCSSALLGFSSLWDTWGLQLSRLPAGKRGAACLLTACPAGHSLEQPELTFLSCAPAARSVRGMVGGESNCAAPGVPTVRSEEACATCGVRRVSTGLLAERPNYLVRQVSLGLACLENTHPSKTKRIGFLFCT